MASGGAFLKNERQKSNITTAAGTAQAHRRKGPAGTQRRRAYRLLRPGRSHIAFFVLNSEGEELTYIG